MENVQFWRIQMKELLIETIPFQPLLTEGIQELSGGKIRVTGKFQHCGIVNKNNRIYPKKIWEAHLSPNSEFIKRVKARGVYGQIEHPRDGKSDLKETAIVVTDVAMKSNGEIYGTLETCRTESGKTAAALILDGIAVGVSSRAHGSVVQRQDGVYEVQEDFVPETFDFVAD